MEGGGLFNQAFLGGDFLWWIGQVVDDCVWKENILSGKFKNAESIPGWGRRYKVRIMGIHDQGTTAIKDEELPWAQVMYPITGGGGQANSIHTPNIRQGMMVFGFFLDGPDLQQPVIMGILGNNAQTELKTKIGEDDVTNTQPGSLATSGWAEGMCPPTPGTKVPDEAKVVEKPTSKTQQKENSIEGSGPIMDLDKYGLPTQFPRSKDQLKDVASGLAEVAKRDDLRTKMGMPALTKDQADGVVKSIVEAGRKTRSALSQTPGQPAQKGATKENPDAIHEMAAADTILEKQLQKKTALLIPQDMVGSATKAMQTEIDNLSGQLNNFLGAIGNYTEAVSGPPTDMQQLIKGSASQNSKYMKVIMDKVMEFTNKTMNKELTKAINQLPISKRSMFGDMKEILTQNNLKTFNKITGGLGGLLEGILTKSLDVENKVQEAQAVANSPLPEQTPIVGIETTTAPIPAVAEKPPTYPKVPICYAEDVVGQVLAASREAIDEANNSAINGLNAFIGDMKSELEEQDAKMNTVRDASRDGAVIQLTDEEVLSLQRGGSGYTPGKNLNVGTTLRSNVRPGITTTTDGTGLLVDYNVATTGAADNFITLTAGGTGYTTTTSASPALTSSSGSGTGCKVNIGSTTGAGVIEAITINASGDGYVDGEVLTILGGGGNATFEIDTVTGPIEAGSIVIADPGSRYTVGDVITVNAGNQDATFTITGTIDPGATQMEPPAAGSPGAPKSLSSLLSNLNNLTSSLTSALNFKNITSKVFPFEMPANKALSEVYTLARGGSAAADTQQPSMKSIADRGSGMIPDIKVPDKVPFLQPSKDAEGTVEDGDEGTFKMY
tara:strand:- start:642 stop:3155 length:2514 start_codon:yes stop_codon:yes gene_type:complete